MKTHHELWTTDSTNKMPFATLEYLGWRTHRLVTDLQLCNLSSQFFWLGTEIIPGTLEERETQ